MTRLDVFFAGRDRVLIHQTKEWGEILLGFESKNRFELNDDSGNRLGLAAEEAKGLGAFFLRNIFGRCRKATIHLYGADGEDLGRGEKPFRWYFHRMEIYDGETKIGAVQRKFSILHRIFMLENARGDEVLEIRSPLFRIWTFKLLFQDKEVGCIRKKWGGLLREMFTDADIFGVEVEPQIPIEVKNLLLVATFLIDFTCFENNTGQGGIGSFGE